MGTTAAQKKLFFNLRRLKRELTIVEEIRVSSSDLIALGTNVSSTESGGVEMHNYLRAVVSTLANADLRQRLELLIEASLARSCGDGAGWRLPPEVESGPVFAGGRVFSFGSFRLLPSQRLLLEGGRRVRIGSRAFDILTVLVDRAGEVVSKDELIDRVWPKVFVDDSNLKTQVSALRRALGEGHASGRFIVTVPGRGYSFVAPVTFEGSHVAEAPAVATAGIRNLSPTLAGSQSDA